MALNSRGIRRISQGKPQATCIPTGSPRVVGGEDEDVRHWVQHLRGEKQTAHRGRQGRTGLRYPPPDSELAGRFEGPPNWAQGGT